MKEGADEIWRPVEYIDNQFEIQGDVVIDHSTSLMWQKASSGHFMPPSYQEAQEYTRLLNQEKFAGYDDWRLPTIPELLSLLEPEKQSNDRYIDPVFDAARWWFWSADEVRMNGERSALSVNFNLGGMYLRFLYSNYVRAVRSWQ